MNQTVIPPPAEWPNWDLPKGLNLFVIIVGFVVAVVFPVIPDVSGLPLALHWGIPVLFLMPLIVWLGRKVSKTINTARLRTSWYGKLHKRAELAQQELGQERTRVESLNKELDQERTRVESLNKELDQERTRVESLNKELRREKANIFILGNVLATCIKLLQTFKIVDVVKSPNGAVYLVVEKSEPPRLKPGDMLMVVDSRDLEPLGQWRVEGSLDAGHFASAFQIRDEPWWKDMRQKAELHQHIDSTTMAILIPETALLISSQLIS